MTTATKDMIRKYYQGGTRRRVWVDSAAITANRRSGRKWPMMIIDHGTERDAERCHAVEFESATALELDTDGRVCAITTGPLVAVYDPDATTGAIPHGCR